MIKALERKILHISAGFVAGMMIGSAPAYAGAGGGGGNNFSNIAENIVSSIQSLPGLISGLAYMAGLLLGVLGILKIKDHVENPTQEPLKNGAIRLAAGGALFALPIVLEAMQTSIGTGAAISTPELNKVQFSVGG